MLGLIWSPLLYLDYGVLRPSELQEHIITQSWWTFVKAWQLAVESCPVEDRTAKTQQQ